MNRAISLPVLLPVLSVALFAQQYKSAPAGAPPSDLAPAVASALDTNGFKITKADGSAVMEIWFRKAAPSGPKSSGDAIALPGIPVGSFLGVVKLESKGEDRRGQSLAAGTYTLRYVLMPSNGDHLGAAPQRDFAALTYPEGARGRQPAPPPAPGCWWYPAPVLLSPAARVTFPALSQSPENPLFVVACLYPMDVGSSSDTT